MPLMCRKKGKVTRILDNILGTPPNQHEARVNTPRIREIDVQRVLLMLGGGGMPNNGGMMPDNGNNQMPMQ